MLRYILDCLQVPQSHLPHIHSLISGCIKGVGHLAEESMPHCPGQKNTRRSCEDADEHYLFMAQIRHGWKAIPSVGWIDHGLLAPGMFVKEVSECVTNC